MTKVINEEMILAIDWIRVGPKNAWRQLLAEKSQLIFTGKEDFEASESDDVEHKSSAKDADQTSGEDDEVQEVAPEDTGAGGTQMTTLTVEGILIETLQDTVEMLEGESLWWIPPRNFWG
jgi:hypothetical protein